MKYPKIILPQKSYKKIDCELSDFSLIRHFVLKDGIDVLDDAQDINAVYIAEPTKRIGDYSVNLFGIFKLKHLAIELTDVGKEKYNVECEPNESVKKPTFNLDFILQPNRQFFSINIAQILADPSVLYSDNGQEKLGKCSIVHSPMRWNFWHFSIRWQNDVGDYLHFQSDKAFRTGWQRSLSISARHFIQHRASLSEPPNISMPANYYRAQSKFLRLLPSSIRLLFVKIKAIFSLKSVF